MLQLEKTRRLSSEELALLGMKDIAYVKRIIIDDEPYFAIHAANGEQLILLRDREVAFAAVRQHDIEPVSVH